MGALRHRTLGELPKIPSAPEPRFSRGSDDSKVVLPDTILPRTLPSPVWAILSLEQNLPPTQCWLPGAQHGRGARLCPPLSLQRAWLQQKVTPNGCHCGAWGPLSALFPIRWWALSPAPGISLLLDPQLLSHSQLCFSLCFRNLLDVLPFSAQLYFFATIFSFCCIKRPFFSLKIKGLTFLLFQAAPLLSSFLYPIGLSCGQAANPPILAFQLITLDNYPGKSSYSLLMLQSCYQDKVRKQLWKVFPKEGDGWGEGGQAAGC